MKLKGMIFVLVIFFFYLGTVRADDLDNRQKALNIIADFADKFCKEVPRIGKSSSKEITGDTKLELKGLLKKIADLGFGVRAKYNSNNYEGLLQTDLASTIQDNIKCRLKIWGDLKDKLLTDQPTSKTNKKPNSKPIDHQQTHFSPNVQIASNNQSGGITAQNVTQNTNIIFIDGVTIKEFEEVVDKNNKLDEFAKVTYEQGVHAFDTARKTLDKGQYGTAIDFLNLAANLMKKPEPYIYLGSSYLALSKGKEAVQAYKNAINLDKNNRVAWIGLGLAYKELKKHEEAINALNTALSIYSNDCSTRSSLGDVFLETGRFSDARLQFETATNQDHNCAQSYLGLALTENAEMTATGVVTEDRVNKLFQYLNKVLEIDPYNEMANEALALFTGKRKIQAPPENADALIHFGLAEKLFSMGDYKEALAEYKEAAIYEPNNSTIHLFMGDAYLNMQQWDEAIKCYKHSADLDPANFRAWRFLGDTYERLGRLTDAKAAYEKSLQINPDYLLAKKNLYLVKQKIMNSE